MMLSVTKRNVDQYHRVFREANGLGPWPCAYDLCDELVQPDELHVHHLDEDHTNDDPSNLAAMHSPCHTKFHHVGKIVSDETRAKIGDIHRGKAISAEHRAQIGEALRGYRHSPETRAKMSAAHMGKPHPQRQRQRG